MAFLRRGGREALQWDPTGSSPPAGPNFLIRRRTALSRNLAKPHMRPAQTKRPRPCDGCAFPLGDVRFRGLLLIKRVDGMHRGPWAANACACAENARNLRTTPSPIARRYRSFIKDLGPQPLVWLSSHALERFRFGRRR
jgi:hypothetical protein